MNLVIANKVVLKVYHHISEVDRLVVTVGCFNFLIDRRSDLRSEKCSCKSNSCCIIQIAQCSYRFYLSAPFFQVLPAIVDGWPKGVHVERFLSSGRLVLVFRRSFR